MNLGFDYFLYEKLHIKVPLEAKLGHMILVGGSGSGKTTAILYICAKMKQAGFHVNLWICDFKKSHEFIGISPNFAEFEACYEKIVEFYEMFLTLEEGGNGTDNILLIDEVAGMLMYFSMSKESKEKAERIRMIMCNILMLGRSRRCYVWIVLQRYSASIFPASSGAVDNFHIIMGLGRLTIDGRCGLFGGEHCREETELMFGQGTGIVLIDGQPLHTVIIPRVSKKNMLYYLAN